MEAPSPPFTTRQRWDAVDVARGVAIVAMVIYHFAWDLSFLRLIPGSIIGDPAWNWFARAIAGSFLTLVGVGLALAHASGFRRGAFLKRLAKVGGAALAVTLVTVLAFPDSYIFFGILHCIAVSSVLALGFLRAPGWLIAAATTLSFAAPFVLTQMALDHPALDWLGLGSEDPLTNDYVPLLPWFGAVLAGLGIGRMFLSRGETMSLARWRPYGVLGRGLARMGRYSLPIYLIHQPVLLAALYGVLALTGPNPTAVFVGQCRADCERQSGNPAMCRAFCPCVADQLKSTGDFAGVIANEADPAIAPKVTAAAQLCLRRNPS